MKANLLLIGAIAVLTGIAQGKECKGVNFPEQMQVDGNSLVLNGIGLRQATMFKVNVYVAALYMGKTSTEPNTILDSTVPKELILQFVRDVGVADLSKGWNEGFERRTPKRSRPP